MHDPQSLLDLFLANVKARFDAPAAMTKREGAYVKVTWGELAREIDRVATGLLRLGLQPADRVCILSGTRLEWAVADLGILAAGGTTVPIYPSCVADDCQYILEDSGAVVVVAENAEQVQKLRSERARLPRVRKVIQLDGAVEGDEWVMSYRDLCASAEPDLDALAERRKSLTRDSVLTIIYTSGTTGRPKGVVLTHDNMLYEAQCLVQIDLVREDDVQLIFLPLAHVFAKLLMVAWLATRHVLAFAENLDSIKQNLIEVRPTVMAGVPRVFEKFHAAVMQKGSSASGLARQMFAAAVRLSERQGKAENGGAPLTRAEQLELFVVRKLVFAKVGKNLRAALGGRMRFVVSGGAPLSPKIGWFFRDAGLEVLEGYGLTETSAATTCNRPGQSKIGTVGFPLPGTEVKIAADGEILVKGRGVMREYWRQPEATAEVLRDGWFHTGDVGVLDERGALRITDRKKDIIITAGGKNVAPQNIENQLKAHRLISQVVVHGDGRKYLSALITLDPDGVRQMALEHTLGNGSYTELLRKPEVLRMVDAAVAELNSKLASFETIKRYHVLDHEFSQERGELTPSLKIKRKVVCERYRAILDAFYDEP